MRLLKVALVIGLLAVIPGRPVGQASAGKRTVAPSGVRLEELTWIEAERHLTTDALVLLPLGAAAKQHGPHLKLRNDLILAEYLTRRVIAASPVVVAPPLTYHFYPAFLEYPGSTSLGMNTARDMTADVIRSYARQGPRRFYVLNTGISTLRPLLATARMLADEGILVHYTDLEARLDAAARTVRQQTGGTHADELETSMMLYIDGSVVDMTKAVRDYTPSAAGPLRLTRRPNGPGTFSASGIWGDPTLATREKGRVLVETLVEGILMDLDQLRKAALPQPTTRAAEPQVPPPMVPPAGRGASQPEAGGCLPGDERFIQAIGPAFSTHWTNRDAEKLAALWSAEGDIVHPDGMIERSSQLIRQNRAYLFSLPEYNASRHSLAVGQIRCLTTGIAVADGKWELRDVFDAGRQRIPPVEGQCTLVLKKSGGGWLIEAYRYTIKPRPGPPPPTFLKRPGFISK